MSLLDHLEKLKHFSSVAKYGSINQASKKLGLSQPSLTHSIKVLEQDLNCALFVRTSKGTVATEQGEVLLEFANRIASLTQAVEARLHHGDTQLEVRLRVGTHESISIYFFPYFLKYLNSAYPKLQIALKTGRSRLIIDLLKKGEIDVAITVNPPHSAAINSFKLFEDQFNFYILPSIKSIRHLPIILMPDALEMSGETLQTILTKKTSSKARLMECENHETVRALAEEGLGIALLPDLVTRASVSRGLLTRVPGTSLPANLAPHTIALSYLRNRSDEPAIQRLQSETTRYVDRWLSMSF